MRVAVLGCGPAGLLAAWAAQLEKHHVTIYSKKQMSAISGAQYLHSAIPDITDPHPEKMVRYFKIGTAEGYARKVYGIGNHTSSWDRWKPKEYPAWSLRGAYDHLWQIFYERIRDTDDFIDYDYVRALMDEYDIVINSIPLKHICGKPESCSFSDQPTWIRDEEPCIPEDCILYNGLDSPGWHRASNLDGRFFVEYGYPVPGAFMILKPQRNTCLCYPTSPRFMNVGRYGTWTRDVLTHDAFHEARIQLA